MINRKVPLFTKPVKLDKYEVSGIEPVVNDENEIEGGDSEPIKKVSKKSVAFKLAEKESKKKKWHEVQVRLYDVDGELRGHWYFAEGKLKMDMSI
jgi:hypothetical protein